MRGSWDRSKAAPYVNKNAFGSKVFKQEHQVKNRDYAATSRLPRTQWDRRPGRESDDCLALFGLSARWLRPPRRDWVGHTVGAFRFLPELRVFTTAQSSVDRDRVVLMPDRLQHFADDLSIADDPACMPEEDSRSDLCASVRDSRRERMECRRGRPCGSSKSNRPGRRLLKRGAPTQGS